MTHAALIEAAIAAASALSVTGCAGALLYEWATTRSAFWLAVLATPIAMFAWLMVTSW